MARILIIGNGAVGKTLAAIALLNNNHVDLVIRKEQERLDLNKHGLTISGSDFKNRFYVGNNFKVIQEYGLNNQFEHDMIIVSTKATHLEVLTTQLGLYVQLATNRIPLLLAMNGMGIEELILKTISNNCIVMPLVILFASTALNTTTVSLNTSLPVIGNICYSNTTTSQLFTTQLSIEFELLEESIFHKKRFIKTIMSSIVCGLSIATNRKINRLFKDEKGHFYSKHVAIAKMMVIESILIGSKVGIDLDTKDTDDIYHFMFNNSLDHYPSLYLDKRNKFETEVDFINGYFHFRGLDYHIETPYHTMFYQLIKNDVALPINLL